MPITTAQIRNSERFDEDAEIESAVQRAISNLDVGGDGYISPSEMTHFWGSLKVFWESSKLLLESEVVGQVLGVSNRLVIPKIFWTFDPNT